MGVVRHPIDELLARVIMKLTTTMNVEVGRRESTCASVGSAICLEEGPVRCLLTDGSVNGRLNSKQVMVVVEALPSSHYLTEAVTSVFCIAAIVTLFVEDTAFVVIRRPIGIVTGDGIGSKSATIGACRRITVICDRGPLNIITKSDVSATARSIINEYAVGVIPDDVAIHDTITTPICAFIRVISVVILELVGVRIGCG